MVFSWLWVYMEVTPLFFLECVYLSLFYPSFAFDIWYVLFFSVRARACVCVCVLEWFRIRHIQKNQSQLNLMKLKAQMEILEDKTTHYKAKYQEIGQELITEIRELCPTETQNFLIELWEENGKKEEEKSRKYPGQKTTWLKILPQKEEEKEKDGRYNPQTATTAYKDYMQSGQNTQEQSTPRKKTHFPHEKHRKKNHLKNYYTQQNWPNYYSYDSKENKTNPFSYNKSHPINDNTKNLFWDNTNKNHFLRIQAETIFRPYKLEEKPI